MATLQEKLEQRRRQQENAVVYEAYGQRRQTFKEGRSRLYRKESCEQQLKALTKAAGTPVVEPCPIEFPPDAELTPEQEQLVAEAPPPGPPPPPPEIKVRTHWEQLSAIRFPQDRQSPEVKHKASEIARQYKLPTDVCLRLALLFQFQDTERGVDILEIYLGALRRLKEYVSAPRDGCYPPAGYRVCQVVEEIVEGQDETTSDRRTNSDSFHQVLWRKSTTALDSRAIEDVYAGTSASPEFQEVNKRIKTLGQRLDETRCCVIKTEVRTYSLIMNKVEDVNDLFAVVDVLKGHHGPAVWRTDHTAADAVFRTDYGMKADYALSG
ncbi:hypothetical protein CSUI_002747 [Cystoisospora suis]|uniref:Uncharacterized protein n=1 Tax=Cystoisospora suis TaxID=483139 RepID=A0A2C6L6X1_9APIC|nr:hypothetical protein CSUI_002747 [Cystoisospora suis]